MPFDGSGGFNRVHNWTNDAAASVKIKADRHDAEDNNFASGLSSVLTKDGQTQPTADIPMNGKKLINLGAPTNPTDAATKAYADSIRSFNTAINLSGAVPEARIGFTQADIGFGARVAGTPAGSYNRWVWNDKPDLSGNDTMVLSDPGTLSLRGNTFAYNVFESGGGWATMSAGFAAWLSFDRAVGAFAYYRTAATLAAGAAAAPVAVMNFDADNDVNFSNNLRVTTGNIYGVGAGSSTGTTLWAKNPAEANSGGTVATRGAGYGANPSGIDFLTGPSGTWGRALSLKSDKSAEFLGPITAAGNVTSTQNFVSSIAAVVLAATGAGTVYLRPNGSGSGVGQTTIASNGAMVVDGGVTADAVTGNQILSLTGNLITRASGASNAHVIFQNNAGAAAGYAYWAPSNVIFLSIGAQSAQVHSNGNLVISGAVGQKSTGTTWANPSDERIKEVVGDYPTGLAEIRQLQPRVFVYKGNDTQGIPGTDPMDPDKEIEAQSVPYPDSPHHQMAVDGVEVAGFVAQEVEAVMPAMVTQTTGYIDGEEVADFRILDTTNLTLALVNAVKELAERVELLEAA